MRIFLKSTRGVLRVVPNARQRGYHETCPKGRYFDTAAWMDEAFLSLLEEKDFAYVTVKEICRRAEVNRSTFYLHYETMDDLLLESVEWMIGRFREHMALDAADVIERIRTCPLSELSFMTLRYLLPYLSYLEKNKRLFLTALRNAKTLELEKAMRAFFGICCRPYWNDSACRKRGGCISWRFTRAD